MSLLYPVALPKLKFKHASFVIQTFCLPTVVMVVLASGVVARPAYACELPKSFYKHVSCTANNRYFLAIRDSGAPVALINTQGQKVADLMRYSQVDASKLVNGVMPVQASGKVGYINTRGREVVPTVYDSLANDANTNGWARAANNNRIVVKKGGQFGVISTSNQIIVPFSSRYQNIQDFKNNKALVEKSSEKFWIGTNGRRIADSNPAPVQTRTSNTTTTNTSNNSNANTTRKSRPTPQANSSRTEPAVAPVNRINNEVWKLEKRDGKWGYINSAGVTMVRFAFDEARPFSEGLAGVRVNNNWGFIDLSGELAIPFRFSADGVLTADDNLDNNVKESEQTTTVANTATYLGQPSFVFIEGKAWIGSLNDGTKLCIDKQGTNVDCDEPFNAVKIETSSTLLSTLQNPLQKPLQQPIEPPVIEPISLSESANKWDEQQQPASDTYTSNQPEVNKILINTTLPSIEVQDAQKSDVFDPNVLNNTSGNTTLHNSSLDNNTLTTPKPPHASHYPVGESSQSVSQIHQVDNINLEIKPITTTDTSSLINVPIEPVNELPLEESIVIKDRFTPSNFPRSPSNEVLDRQIVQTADTKIIDNKTVAQTTPPLISLTTAIDNTSVKADTVMTSNQVNVIADKLASEGAVSGSDNVFVDSPPPILLVGIAELDTLAAEQKDVKPFTSQNNNLRPAYEIEVDSSMLSSSMGFGLDQDRVSPSVLNKSIVTPVAPISSMTRSYEIITNKPINVSQEDLNQLENSPSDNDTNKDNNNVSPPAPITTIKRVYTIK